jgi:hypothetical protein
MDLLLLKMEGNLVSEAREPVALASDTSGTKQTETNASG